MYSLSRPRGTTVSLRLRRLDSVVGALYARSLEQRILVAKEGKNKSRAFIYVIVFKWPIGIIYTYTLIY